MNAFVSLLNPTVLVKCPFCPVRETIFHCFVHCPRLLSLFGALRTLLLSFNEQFTEQMFIFGFSYIKNKKKKGRQLNFLFGQAKLAIYLSRKEKLDRGQRCDCLLNFKSLVRACIMLEYRYYVKMERRSFSEIVGL